MSFLEKIKSRFKKEQFNPTLLGLWVNPFYLVRKGLYNQVKDLGKKVQGNILDVGCGTKPYQHLFNAVSYTGLEIERTKENATDETVVLYDGKHFPFNDSFFDAVFTSQVFEHVFNPPDFLKEINRVLVNGGVLLMTVPFIWDEHEQPYDYGRYSSFGLKSILENNGFEIAEQRKSVTGYMAVMQLFISYWYKVLVVRAHLPFTFFTLLISPCTIMGAILGKILPKNHDLYVDNIVLAKKK